MRIKAFTLIETIIVVGITGLILPVVFSIVFVILQQQTKIIRLQEVKKQGDFVLSNIKTAIRNNAVEIYTDRALTDQKCHDLNLYDGSGGNNFYFKDKVGRWFNFYLDNDKISSGSSLFAGNPQDLTNDKVIVSNFSIKCAKQSIYSPALVTLSIALSFNTTSTRPEDTAQLTYNTNIKLKSY